MRPSIYSIGSPILIICLHLLIWMPLHGQTIPARANLNWAVKADSLHVIYAMVVDEHLNTYVTGYGPKYLPGERLDGIVTKYSKRGEHLWTTFLGGSDTDACKNIVIDKDGNLIVAGSTKSSTGFATDLTTMKGMFIAKLDSAEGTILWVTNFGGSKSIDWTIGGANIDQIEGLTTDNDGNIFISGVTESNDLPNTISGNEFRGYKDAFLAKFSSSGVLYWNRYYGGAVAESGNVLVVDKNNTIWMGGITSSKTGIVLNGFDNPLPDYNSCGFIAQFDQDGQQLWGTHYGGTQYLSAYTEVTDMIIDQQDNLVVTGFTTSDSYIATDGYDITQNGYYDMFILKMNLDKQKIWATYFGGKQEDKSYGVAVDTLGNIFIEGITNNGGLGYAGFNNLFAGDGFLPVGLAAKFSADGKLCWSTYLDSRILAYKPNKTIAAAPSKTVVIANTHVQSLEDINVKNIFNTAYVSGYVFVDENNNCLKDPGELPISNMIIKTNSDSYADTTDATGYFLMATHLGNYTITALVSSYPEKLAASSCVTSDVVINLMYELDTANINFPLKHLPTPVITSAIDESPLARAIVYPNPCKGKFKLIQVPYSAQKIEIFNIVGKSILFDSEIINEQNIEIKLNAEPGLYFIAITFPNGKQILKTLVQ